MGKHKKPGASLLFPSSKFLHLATLARGCSRKACRSAPEEAFPALSKSGHLSIGAVVGPSSSSDMAIDVDLHSSADGASIPVVSEVGGAVGSSADASPAVGHGKNQATGKSSGLKNSGASQIEAPRLLADRIRDSSRLEELGSPTTHVSGVPFVLIPDDNIAAAKEEFKEFLFARFPGDVPSMGRIIGVINAIWARSGPRIFVHNVGQGTFLLKVVTEQTRGLLLSRQVWMIAGCPMFLAPWSPDFSPEESQLTSAVVPVELRGVPYLLFNRQSLSRIATAVGKPVSLAPETERKENFEVAKVWVHVDLLSELPTKIISGYSNGRENEILVSYPWLPKKCEKCEKFGHDQYMCPSAVSNGRKKYDNSHDFGPQHSAARSTSRESKTRRRSRPSRSQRQKREQIYRVKAPDVVNENQSSLQTQICLDEPPDHSAPTISDGREPPKVAGEGNEEGSSADIDCNIPRIVVKDWAAEVESQPHVMITNSPAVDIKESASSSKQIVSLDRNVGFSTVHVYHDDGGSNIADSGAPFILVSNRKSSRKATKA